MDFLSKIITRPKSVNLLLDDQMDIFLSPSSSTSSIATPTTTTPVPLDILPEANNNSRTPKQQRNKSSEREFADVEIKPEIEEIIVSGFNENNLLLPKDSNHSLSSILNNKLDTNALKDNSNILPDIVNFQPNKDLVPQSKGEDSFITSLTAGLGNLHLNTPPDKAGSTFLTPPLAISHTSGDGGYSGFSSDDEAFAECQTFIDSNDILNQSRQWSNVLSSVSSQIAENIENVLEQVDTNLEDFDLPPSETLDTFDPTVVDTSLTNPNSTIVTNIDHHQISDILDQQNLNKILYDTTLVDDIISSNLNEDDLRELQEIINGTSSNIDANIIKEESFVNDTSLTSGSDINLSETLDVKEKVFLSVGSRPDSDVNNLNDTIDNSPGKPQKLDSKCSNVNFLNQTIDVTQEKKPEPEQDEQYLKECQIIDSFKFIENLSEQFEPDPDLNHTIDIKESETESIPVQQVDANFNLNDSFNSQVQLSDDISLNKTLDNLKKDSGFVSFNRGGELNETFVPIPERTLLSPATCGPILNEPPAPEIGDITLDNLKKDSGFVSFNRGGELNETFAPIPERTLSPATCGPILNEPPAPEIVDRKKISFDKLVNDIESHFENHGDCLDTTNVHIPEHEFSPSASIAPIVCEQAPETGGKQEFTNVINKLGNITESDLKKFDDSLEKTNIPITNSIKQHENDILSHFQEHGISKADHLNSTFVPNTNSQLNQTFATKSEATLFNSNNLNETFVPAFPSAGHIGFNSGQLDETFAPCNEALNSTVNAPCILLNTTFDQQILFNSNPNHTIPEETTTIDFSNQKSDEIMVHKTINIDQTEQDNSNFDMKSKIESSFDDHVNKLPIRNAEEAKKDNLVAGFSPTSKIDLENKNSNSPRGGSKSKDIFVDTFVSDHDVMFKTPFPPSSMGNKRRSQERHEFTDDDFQSNGIILNPSDFDFLLSKGNNNIEIDRSSLLLRFDPLLGHSVVVNQHTLQEQQQQKQQQQQQQQPCQNNTTNLSNTSSKSSINQKRATPTQEPLDIIYEAKSSPGESPIQQLQLSDKSQNVDAEEEGSLNVTNPLISSVHNEPIKVLETNKPTTFIEPGQDNKENKDKHQQKSRIQKPSTERNISLKDIRSQKQDIKNDVKMSVDVIRDIKADNDVKSFDNISEQCDEKKDYKMAELEKKIKNESLKTEDIEKKLKDAEQREEALLKRITEKDKTIAKMSGVMEAYEKAIAELIAEKEQIQLNYDKQLTEIKSDRDLNYQHLTSLEATFSDLHAKYERSKQISTALKSNEEALLAEKKQNLEHLRLQEIRYEKMKNHAMQQLEIANNKLEALTKNHSSEMTKLKALLKKEEISRLSTNEQLQQKSRENEELMKICDELINGQGS